MNVPELPLHLVKEIRNWKNQILLAIGFAGLVQIGLHFWHWPHDTIALIDTGSEVPGVSLGILVSAPRAP